MPDNYNSSYTGPQIDEAVGSALNPDTTPTQNSDSLITSGGVYGGLSGKQSTITANGILKGDGAGGISAALAGIDYGTYNKPAKGIPKTDLASAVQTSLGRADSAYIKPANGIPKTDLASAVQTSLGRADSAYIKPANGIPASDLASGVIPSVPSASDATPQALGTAAAGVSGDFSRADHVHQKPTYSKTDVGLGNVANERQYSSNNPPPYPVTSVNGNTGAVTVSVPTAYTSNPAMDGTASPGSSTSWAKGDHVHPHDTTKANTSDLPSVPRLQWYGVCDSAANASEKALTINGITQLASGLVVTVRMTNAQTYNGSPTLNLNDLGAKEVRRRFASNQQIGYCEWQAGAVLDFLYNGSYWLIVNGSHSSTNYYGLSKPSSDTPLMDGTASVGSSNDYARGDHVHPSDTTKANQTQLATVESGTTASKAYLAREYFCLNGILYRTIEPISKSALFTPGTNCEQVNVGDELSSRCRSMTKSVAAGKSVDITITGNNYGPNHGFLLISTGNSGAVMGAWLCFGLGVRYNYHVIQNLFTAASTTISLTSTANGKYTYTNSNTTYGSVISVVILQEAGTGYLSLSDAY